MLQREVAIKQPHARLDAAAAESFAHEARLAAKIRHPGIVIVHDFGIDEAGIPFVVYEYVEGGPLKARLSGRPWPLTEALELAVVLAEALSAAHKLGLTHRDLKPANILLDQAGRPRITDFGLAVEEEQQPALRGESRALTATCRRSRSAATCTASMAAAICGRSA